LGQDIRVVLAGDITVIIEKKIQSEEEGSVTDCREVGKAITYQLKTFCTLQRGGKVP